VYRYLKMDPRDRCINSKKPLLLHTYDEINRDEGYANLRLNRNSLPEQVIEGSFHFSRPRKALYDQNLVYAKESFQVFPDLLLSDITFESSQKISNANPQQDEYQWGTAEIVNWTSLDGEALEGMLFKPEDFNPEKQYPMIVNFYEKKFQRTPQAPTSQNGALHHQLFPLRQ
jgi:hypothetical protein